MNEHSMNMTRRSVENGLGHCFVSAVNSQALMVIRMNAIHSLSSSVQLEVGC